MLHSALLSAIDVTHAHGIRFNSLQRGARNKIIQTIYRCSNLKWSFVFHLFILFFFVSVLAVCLNFIVPTHLARSRRSRTRARTWCFRLQRTRCPGPRGQIPWTVQCTVHSCLSRLRFDLKIRNNQPIIINVWVIGEKRGPFIFVRVNNARFEQSWMRSSFNQLFPKLKPLFWFVRVRWMFSVSLDDIIVSSCIKPSSTGVMPIVHCPPKR